MPEVAVLDDFGLPRKQLRVGPRTFKADQDPALGVLLTAASWCLQQLPHKVVEEQRAAIIETLARSKSLMVVVVCGPRPAIRIYDGARLLVEIPAKL
jgi:hypothetical protein